MASSSGDTGDHPSGNDESIADIASRYGIRTDDLRRLSEDI